VKGEVVFDLPGEEFARRPGLSASFLRDMLAYTPAEAKRRKEEGRPDSEAMQFGRLLHMVVLEPERAEQALITEPEFSGKGARSMRAEWLLRNSGKIPVKPKVQAQLLAMADAVMAHPKAGPMFRCIGRNEVSWFWQDRSFGIDCKARADRIFAVDPDTVGMLDLKSTRNAKEGFFRYDVRQYGYDVEAVYYTRAVESIYGVEHKRPFYFVAVEKTAPHRVEVWPLLKAERVLAWQKTLKAMEVYAECVRTGVWSERPIEEAA
jgi:hypothetical protein